jgi:predicted RNA-binding protein with PUA domain
MKIAICSSMAFAKEMIESKRILESKKHTVILPRNTENYVAGNLKFESHKESAENKIKHNLFKHYFDEIKKSDAILVVNKDKNNVKNYIGGNTLIEMAFAHVLDKKIFLLNPIPDLSYSDEIIGMQPIILNGDLNNII